MGVLNAIIIIAILYLLWLSYKEGMVSYKPLSGTYKSSKWNDGKKYELYNYGPSDYLYYKNLSEQPGNVAEFKYHDGKWYDYTGKAALSTPNMLYWPDGSVWRRM